MSYEEGVWFRSSKPFMVFEKFRNAKCSKNSFGGWVFLENCFIKTKGSEDSFLRRPKDVYRFLWKHGKSDWMWNTLIKRGKRESWSLPELSWLSECFGSSMEVVWKSTIACQSIQSTGGSLPCRSDYRNGPK